MGSWKMDSQLENALFNEFPLNKSMGSWKMDSQLENALFNEFLY